MINKIPICFNSKGGRNGKSGLQPSLTDRVYDTNACACCITTSSFFMPCYLVEESEVTPMSKELGTLKGLGGVWDNMYEQSGRVYDTHDTSPTLHTNGGGNQEPKILTPEKKPRIRKLTPKECWRLMGFDDEDFDTAKKALNETHYNGRDRSNSQLYKQAGNSIVVNVLEGVLRELFLVEHPCDKKQAILDWLDSL